MAKLEGKLTFGWGGDDISPEKMMEVIDTLDDIEKLRHIANICVAGMAMTRDNYDLPAAYVSLEMMSVRAKSEPVVCFCASVCGNSGATCNSECKSPL